MIKEFIKEITAFVFRFSGVAFLIREILCRDRVTIIVYHNPKTENLKKHLDYLSKCYNFSSLDNLVDAIHNKNWSEIPPKSLIITIDDGYKENYMLLDIFKTYNIHPTIYLCSHIVNTNRKLWYETGFKNFQDLNKLNNKQRLKVLKDKIDYEPQREYSTRQVLNLEELKEMSPYVDFQSHSKFHPILTTCTEEECKEEICESKDYLGEILNKEIKHFNFPNGDYSAREIGYIKKCGYKSARALDIGWNGIDSDPYRLKAMGIEDDASINRLCAQISGFFGYLRFLRHGSFNGVHPPFV